MQSVRPGPSPQRLSVIVPFHRNLRHLCGCLSAIQAAGRRVSAGAELSEVVVVADGAADDPADVARQHGARVLSIPGPSGPAVARSRGAAAAPGDILVFVDADVAIHGDALASIARRFADQPELGALFGSYDEEPEDPGFFSQCRNLSHALIHRRSRRQASTFWAGLGAVRARVFAAVGGFDERFVRPSVEDIDLGYRMRAAGVAIELDPEIQGTHLKRWTLWSSIVSDVRDRGVPWTQLIARYGAMRDDLNISVRYRICVVTAYLMAASLAGALAWPWLAGVALAATGALWWLDGSYYRSFARQRGWVFTIRWFPFHVLHHLCNGLSFGLGNVLYGVRRWTGLVLPWSLPVTAWPTSRPPAPAESYVAQP